MLLSAFKRRWPILTTLVAALLYVVNNYDLRGLGGLHLEPRAPAVAPGSSGYGPAGWPSPLPPGPALPSTQPTTNWPSTSYPNYAGTHAPGPQAPMANTLPSAAGSVGYSNPYPSTSQYPSSPGKPAPSPTGNSLALPGAIPNWEKLLSVGEKLGMLENAQVPAGPSSAGSAGVNYPAAHSAGGQATTGAGLRDTIRLASFNLNGWGEAQRDNPVATQILSRLLTQFDVIALQGIRSRRDDLLPDLMMQLNSGGRKFDFMIGPRLGRGDSREQLAFVFDTERIETDRFQLYTVEDPEDMLHREPLVGWFRARNTSSGDAFTFSFVNVHIDPDLARLELPVLPNLVQAILNDGRGEDDIILAGDFSAGAATSPLFASSGFRLVIEGVATTTRGTQLLDNFAFAEASTAEFTGRAGAVDFLRQYNLSLEQAVSVSEHLPIWAEFSIIEGGRPGQVAGTTLPERRFQGGVN